jgi:hypothetical protein
MPTLRFQLPTPTRLATLRATIHLLYTAHPRAFLTSSLVSLPEPLFFPAILLVLHLLLQNFMGPGGTTRFSVVVAFAGLGVVGLFLVQRLGMQEHHAHEQLRKEAR